MLASRDNLQSGEINEHHPIYQSVANKFNSDECSGGLIDTTNDVLVSSGIDLEVINNSGAITAQRVFDIFHDIFLYNNEIKPLYSAV